MFNSEHLDSTVRWNPSLDVKQRFDLTPDIAEGYSELLMCGLFTADVYSSIVFATTYIILMG